MLWEQFQPSPSTPRASGLKPVEEESPVLKTGEKGLFKDRVYYPWVKTTAAAERMQTGAYVQESSAQTPLVMVQEVSVQEVHHAHGEHPR